MKQKQDPQKVSYGSHNLLPWAYLICLTFLISSCSHKQKEISVPFKSPKAFSVSGSKEIGPYWWKSFQDPKLNKRIKKALKNNFSLASAWQRLKAAKAVVETTNADFVPKVDATASGQDRGQTGGFESDGQQFELGLEASYEVDLFGRIRSQTRAEEYRAQATMADYKTAALTLAAEIARTWYQRIEAEKQLELAKNQLEANKNILSILKTRFGNGLIRSSDILRQRQLVESTQEQVIDAELRVQLLTHQLAVLQGKPPKGIELPDQLELAKIPDMPDTGVPAKLVKRRPDVKSAFLQVQSANQEVASAISNRYPRINLTGSYLTEGENTSVLFNDWLSNIAGSLILPIIDGGERRAEVNRAEAVEKQKVHEYAQTVLTAFREVEDALVQEKKQRERMESLKKQVELTDQTYESLRREYFNGIADYTAVLTTLTELQQLRRDLLVTERNLIESRISLYRALAGGFETPREKSKEDI